MAAISLCMIVKDEGSMIGRCLESARGLADEIIVADTGSTDRTKEIAAKHGAIVIDIPWEDDFSSARNKALEKATKDWILVLDADETISKSDHYKIKELARQKDFLGFMLIQRSYTNDSSSIKWVSAKDDSYEESRPYAGWVYSGITRLFVNDKRIRFEYPVHETVKESIKRIGGQILATDIPIHHYGKLGDNVRKKGEKYLELGRKKLEEKPEAKFYYEHGIQALVLGHEDEAIQSLEKAAEINDNFTAPLISLGTLYIKKKMFDRAIESLGRAMEIDRNDPNIFNNLGVAYERLGQSNKAIEHYKKAVELEPRHVEAYQNLARLLYISKDMAELEKVLRKLVELKPTEPMHFKNLAGLHLQARNFRNAKLLLEHAQQLSPDDNEIEKMLELISSEKKAD